MPDMYATQALTHLVPLAADELDKNKVTPGVLGFLVFAALAVGVWLLMKSMNRHMGKVDFVEAPDPDAVPDEAGRRPRRRRGSSPHTRTARKRSWSRSPAGPDHRPGPSAGSSAPVVGPARRPGRPVVPVRKPVSRLPDGPDHLNGR